MELLNRWAGNPTPEDGRVELAIRNGEVGRQRKSHRILHLNALLNIFSIQSTGQRCSAGCQQNKSLWTCLRCVSSFNYLHQEVFQLNTGIGDGGSICNWALPPQSPCTENLCCTHKRKSTWIKYIIHTLQFIRYHFAVWQANDMMRLHIPPSVFLPPKMA